MAEPKDSKDAKDPKDSKEEKGSAPAPKAQMEVKPVLGDLTLNYDESKYEMPVEVSAFFGGRSLKNRQIEIRDNVTVIASGVTDNRGVVLLTIKGKLKDKEQSKQFRVCLVGTIEESTISINLPSKEKKELTDKDPESLSLYRYHDGCGNIRIFVRILRAGGVGLATTVVIWYKGQKTEYNTDTNGVVDFSLSPLCEGEDNELTAFVSGIEERAKLHIKRPVRRANFFETEHWLYRTNNGRGLIFLAVAVLFWVLVIVKGFFSAPIISGDLFRDSDSGLSSAEQFYNKSAAIANQQSVIPQSVIPPHDVSSTIPDTVIFLGIAFSIFAIVYFIFSWREEIMQGVEEGIEKIIDKNHSRSDDPALEKWVKYFGIKHVVKNPKIQVVNPVNATVVAETAGSGNSGHPSLATLFQLDLMSDILVEIVPKVIKNIFGNRN